MEKLAKYHNTIVRVTCVDGTVFTGPCEQYPAAFCMAELGCDEEALKVDGVMIFADSIRDVEVLRGEVCIPVREWIEAWEEIALWFHERWGIPLEAYRESIRECLGVEDPREQPVPQWYVVVRGSRIIGGCGVIANDFHERKELTPNVCAVYVDEECRNQGTCGFMLQFVCEDMAKAGIGTLYLLTDHVGFYEKYGWEFYDMVRGDDGELSRMYVHHM